MRRLCQLIATVGRRPTRFTLFVFACALILTGPSRAYAHAELVRSTPGNGQQAPTLPASILMTYSEGVQTGTFALLDASGQRVDRGSAQIGGDGRTEVTLPVGEGRDGVYTVRWEVLSEDGHTTKGSFFFVIGERLPDRDAFLAVLTASPADDSGVNPLEPPARALLFLALVILVGVPLSTLLVVQPAARSQDVESEGLWPATRGLLTAGAGLLASASLLLATAQAAGAHTPLDAAAVWGFVSTITLGQMGAARLGLGLVLLLLLRASHAPWFWLAASAAAGVGAQASLSAASHTAALLRSPGPILADFGHLVGGAFWVGGLVVLALVLPRLGGKLAAADRARLMAAVIRRFSTLAILGLAIAISTGLLLASFHVPDWPALWQTLYGSSLTVKVAVVLAAVSLGAFHRLWVLGRMRIAAETSAAEAAVAGRYARLFARSVRVELGLVLGVLLLTGLLTSAPPAASAPASRPQPQPLALRDRLADADVVFTVTPFQVGLNVLDLDITRGANSATDVSDVSVLVRSPDQDVELPRLPLGAIGPGSYSALGSLPLPGEWQVRVSANVGGRFVAHRFDLQLAPPAEPATPDAGQAGATGSFGWVLRVAAIAVAVGGLLFLAGELGWLWRARRLGPMPARLERGSGAGPGGRGARPGSGRPA